MLIYKTAAYQLTVVHATYTHAETNPPRTCQPLAHAGLVAHAHDLKSSSGLHTNLWCACVAVNMIPP